MPAPGQGLCRGTRRPRSPDHVGQDGQLHRPVHQPHFAALDQHDAGGVVLEEEAAEHPAARPGGHESGGGPRARAGRTGQRLHTPRPAEPWLGNCPALPPPARPSGPGLTGSGHPLLERLRHGPAPPPAGVSGAGADPATGSRPPRGRVSGSCSGGWAFSPGGLLHPLAGSGFPMIDRVYSLLQWRSAPAIHTLSQHCCPQPFK